MSPRVSIATSFPVESSLIIFSAADLCAISHSDFSIGKLSNRHSLSVIFGYTFWAIPYATPGSPSFAGQAITSAFFINFIALSVISSGSPGPTPIPYNFPLIFFFISIPDYINYIVSYLRTLSRSSNSSTLRGLSK